MRHHGLAGVALPLLVALLLASAVALLLVETARSRVVKPAIVADVPRFAADSTERARDEHLAAFDALLLPSDDVAEILRDLLVTAQAGNLMVSRGEYTRETDLAGGFVRVRMSFPLRGDGEAIHAYLLAALQAHPALALERLHLQRERSDAREFDARIHWVLFVRPTPASGKDGSAE